MNWYVVYTKPKWKESSRTIKKDWNRMLLSSGSGQTMVRQKR
jgi:hypothetical protein